MVDWGRRGEGTEYMDGAGATGEDLERALVELSWINRFLGGERATLGAFRKMGLKGSVEVLDVGTGAADIPVALVKWGRSIGVEIRVVAVDFNPAVCAWAARHTRPFPEIEVRQADAFALPFAPGSFDYVHGALFLHHFPQPAAARLLQLLFGLCRRGLVINDLHRHPLSFYPVKWGTTLLSRSRMVRHDGPQSVLRGFARGEVEELARQSGVPLSLQWRWAFRWVMTACK